MGCRTCEQMRAAAYRAWRGLPWRHRCAIPGCPSRAVGHLCPAHWRALPLSLRMRWWEETGYGRERPSPDLLAEMIEALKQE